MKTLVFHVAHVYFGAIDADSVSWNAGTSNSPEDNFLETYQRKSLLTKHETSLVIREEEDHIQSFGWDRMGWKGPIRFFLPQIGRDPQSP